MPDWIKLDPARLSRSETTHVHGVEISVGLSPYDIPDAVRGYYDDDVKRFVIEFNYLDDSEKRVPSWQNEHITLYVGQHTGCLYEIHVNVDELEAKTVKLNVTFVKWIDDAIQNLTRDKRLESRKRHYEVANAVVSENAEQLFESV